MGKSRRLSVDHDVHQIVGGTEKAVRYAAGAAGGLRTAGREGDQVDQARLENAPTVATQGQTFTVVSDVEAGGGLTLSAGDEVRVLECDGNAILVEVLGDRTTRASSRVSS